MQNRDLLECVCLAVAALLVMLAVGLPKGCTSNASEVDQSTNRPPSEEMKDQRKTLRKSCDNLMLIRLLVEAELRKAETQNANRTDSDKDGRPVRRRNLGPDASYEAPGVEVRKPGVGKIRR